MTIRIQHIDIQPDERAWVYGEEGVTDAIFDDTHMLDFLSIVRHILRERSDCRFVPVIVGAVTHPTNQYGHNMQVEVNYARSWRAIYGVHVGERVTNVQCYMD